VVTPSATETVVSARDEYKRACEAADDRAVASEEREALQNPYDDFLAAVREVEEREKRERAALERDDRDADASPEPKKFRSPADVLREMPDSGGRFATGFPTLDQLTRGGARPGERWTPVGGPESAKSTFMEQIARYFSDLHRSPVVALHVDEGDAEAMIRLGQMWGFDREKLEAKDPAEIDAFDAALKKCVYDATDPDEVTLEEAGERLKRLASADLGPPVLLIDTLHTVRCAAVDDGGSAKERAERVVETYKATSQLPAIVLVGSEAVKAAYASKDPEKRVEAMAAAAESRAIAHAASVLILLRQTDEEGVFEVRVVKNRPGGGKRGTFYVRLDKAAATLTEVDQVASRDVKAAGKESRRQERVQRLQERAEKLLKQSAEGLSVSALHGRLGGAKAELLAALEGLEAQGVAEWVPGKQGAHVWRWKGPR
jgi:KaiC/GvpD/RAD55 family RecA-like ATPase